MHTARMRVLVAILLMLGACQRPPPAADRPIEMVVSSAPDVIDPRGSTDAISFRVTRLLHAGLFRLGDDLAPVPYVASSYTWRDARTLVVELRHDVHFDDGKPVDADDVIASIAAFGAEGSRQRRVVEAIGNVVAEAPDRVRFELAYAHATLLSDLELPILRAEQARGPLRPAGDLDGLGPYRLQHFADDHLRLAPRAGSPDPTPKSALVIRTVRDENARAMRLFAGEADVVHNGLSPELWPSLEKFADPSAATSVSLRTRPAANLTYLVVRHGRGQLADLRVRQAISLAIDRDAFCTYFFHGHAIPAKSALAPLHWAFDPSAPPLRYDPEASRALLAEHGALTPLVLTTSTDRLRLLMAQYLAQRLEALGLPTRVEPLELGTLLARLGRGDFELAILQMPELTEPNSLRTFLHSTSAPPLGVNRGRYQDEELDRWLDRGAADTDPSARQRDYAEVERLIRERLPLIPLWHEDQVVVTSARARAFMPTAEGRWRNLIEL